MIKGLPAQWICKAGQFRNSKGSCEGCPDGSFMSTPNNDKQCKQCPGGQISSADKTRCVEEPKINIMIKKGHALSGNDGVLIPCPANMYQDEEGKAEMLLSKYQEYSRLLRADKINATCKKCPQGATSPPGSGDCICPPGFTSVKNTRDGGIMCVPLPEPQVPVKVEPQVTQPPVPTILKSENCDPGSYVKDKKCMACPPGTYQYKKLPLNNNEGANACVQCPGDFKCGKKEGASSCFGNAMIMGCPPGSRLGSGENCEECPPGTTSKGSVFVLDDKGRPFPIKVSECIPATKEGFMIPDNKGGSIGIIIGISIAIVIAGFVIYKRRM